MLQTDKSKKILIIWGSIYYSSVIFHRVVSFLRKSQVLNEGIQGKIHSFFEFNFIVKYNKTELKNYFWLIKYVFKRLLSQVRVY
jgi:hypothetical protein